MNSSTLSNEDQSVLDEIESLLESDGSNSTEDNPDKSGEGSGGSPNDNSTIRQLRATLKKAHKELKGRSKSGDEERSTTPPAPQSSPPPRSNADMGAMLYMHFRQAAREEMLKAGLNPDTYPEMYQAIYNRYFNEHLEGIQAENSAKQNAGTVFDSVASEFPHLNGKKEDISKIREEVGKLGIVQQADPQMVKRVFYQYIGENLDRFKSNGEASSSKDGKADTAGGAAAAAASAVKRGRGLQISDDSDSTEPPPKAPNKDETQKMKRMGLNPANVDHVRRFRKAEEGKSTYAGRVE